MPGIPQWSKNVQVSANPAKRVRAVQLSYTDILAATTGVKSVSVFAPAGYVSRIVGLNFYYPQIGAATAGTLSLTVVSNSIGIISADWNFNTLAQFRYSQFTPDRLSCSPVTEIAQLQAITGVPFDENVGLVFSFWNKTNASDGGVTKLLYMLIEDTKIAG